DSSGNVFTTGHFSSRGIFVSRYDSNGSLVWLKTMAGTAGSGWGYGIAVGGAGNAYPTGQYNGTCGFGPGPGTYYLSSKSTPHNGGPSTDVFVLKLDSTGSLRWAGSMGGAGQDEGYDVAVDGTGNVYVTGSFEPDRRNDFDPGRGTYTLANG